MQSKLAVAAAVLIGSVAAMPAITPAPQEPVRLYDTSCPVSKTIYTPNDQLICLDGFCETPWDAPCSTIPAVTKILNGACPTRPPTTTYVPEVCPDMNCKCPTPTVTKWWQDTWEEPCPASTTIRAHGCFEILCVKPTNGPCTGTTTSTIKMPASCTNKPPTTRYMPPDCSDSNCSCPTAVTTITV